MRRSNPYGFGYDLMAMLMEEGSRGVIFPADGAAFTAATGLTLDSLYLFNEASGNLIDQVGANDLTVVGTPTFETVVEGRVGIHYDTANEAHAADVHAAGVTSILYGVVCTVEDAAASQGLVGRTNASQADGLAMYNAASGTVRTLVRDSGANSFLYDVTGTPINTRLCLCTLQIDRATPRARTRVSGGGVGYSGDVAITGFATLDGASQVFAFGDLQALIFGAKVVYGFVASGTQVEGASLQQNLHRNLGWE